VFVLRCNRLHRSLAVLTQCSQTGTAWLHRHAHDTRTHTADTLHTDRPHTHVHTHTHDTDTRTVTHKHKHTHTYARHLHTGTQTHAYAVFILLTPAAVASEPARRLLLLRRGGNQASSVPPVPTYPPAAHGRMDAASRNASPSVKRHARPRPVQYLYRCSRLQAGYRRAGTGRPQPERCSRGVVGCTPGYSSPTATRASRLALLAPG